MNRAPHVSLPRLASLRVVILGFALLVVVGVWAATAWRLAEDRREAFATAEAELLGAQDLMAAQVGRMIESAASLIDAAENWLVDQQPGADATELALLVDRMQRRHRLPLRLRLFDAAGDMEPILRGMQPINAADREYLRALAEMPDGEFHVGLQVVSRDTGEAVIPVAMRARENPLGVAFIVATIPVAPLERLFDGMLVSAPGTIGIVRTDGYLLFRSPDPAKFVGMRIDLGVYTLDGNRPLQRDSGIVSGRRDAAGNRIVIAFRRVDAQPLVVYASFRIDDIEGRIARPRLWLLGSAWLATLLAAGMAGLAAWFMSMHEREATRVREALVAAEAANAAKREFLANVSHELRTPLNAIIGFSEFVVMQAFGPLPERYRGYVDDVLKAGRHLLGVVDQLLDLAAIEARRLVLRPERLTPADVVGDVIEMMRPIAAERHVSLEILPPVVPAVVTTDARALRQILVNLVGNAVKFSPDGGTVAVQWVPTAEGGLRIAVTDQGPGIPEGDFERIFEPFWRKESAHVVRRGGTGLGLSLTRQLVWRLGGTIDVDSTPGSGSTFAVKLPAVAAEAANAA
jgi:signal transduction histidine kinase